MIVSSSLSFPVINFFLPNTHHIPESYIRSTLSVHQFSEYNSCLCKVHLNFYFFYGPSNKDSAISRNYWSFQVQRCKKNCPKLAYVDVLLFHNVMLDSDTFTSIPFVKLFHIAIFATVFFVSRQSETCCWATKFSLSVSNSINIKISISHVRGASLPSTDGCLIVSKFSWWLLHISMLLYSEIWVLWRRDFKN